MGEGSAARLFLPDRRGDDRYLRVTWHRESRTVVFSHWSGDVCLASTPVALPDASQIIDLLVRSLREAAAPSGRAGDQGADPSGTAAILSRIRRLLGPRLADVVEPGHEGWLENPDQAKRTS